MYYFHWGYIVKALIFLGVVLAASTLVSVVYAAPVMQPAQYSGGYPPYYCVYYSSTIPMLYYYYYSSQPCPPAFHPPNQTPSR